MKVPASVDEYIAQAPKELRPKLEQLRAAIRSAAPDAEERISYRMPSYYYKGRLAYFQLWKEHIGLYALVAPIETHKPELERYVTSKGTIRFPVDEKLPIVLIKRLVKEQVGLNEEAAKKKKEKK